MPGSAEFWYSHARASGRIARIVDLDPESIAPLVDLAKQVHSRGVERRDAPHRRQGVEPGRHGKRQQAGERGPIVEHDELELVVGAEHHGGICKVMKLLFALTCIEQL